MKQEILINGKKYSLEKEEKEGFDLKEVEGKLTEYFDPYEYVVGDWAYGKLRLKGFYDSNNKNKRNFNDIAKVDEYLKNSCAYNCKYFIIKKIN